MLYNILVWTIHFPNWYPVRPPDQLSVLCPGGTPGCNWRPGRYSPDLSSFSVLSCPEYLPLHSWPCSALSFQVNLCCPNAYCLQPRKTPRLGVQLPAVSDQIPARLSVTTQVTSNMKGRTRFLLVPPNLSSDFFEVFVNCTLKMDESTCQNLLIFSELSEGTWTLIVHFSLS